MKYFPINLDIRDKPVVIIGGGAVAARKCVALLDAGARVTVIAPDLNERLAALREQGVIVHRALEYRVGDLSGAFLAFAVTDDSQVNRAVAGEARTLGILADIGDDPESGSFTMPALVRRGELLLAVSTGGASPALARRIRTELEDRYGPEYGLAVELLARLREKLLTESENNAYNKKVLSELVAQDLPALLKEQSTTEIDRLLAKLFGPGYTLAALGVGEKDTE